MPFAGVSSVAVRSEMKHGSSQRHVVLTLNRHYARVDDQESINCQTMTPDTFVHLTPLFTPFVHPLRQTPYQRQPLIRD